MHLDTCGDTIKVGLYRTEQVRTYTELVQTERTDLLTIVLYPFPPILEKGLPASTYGTETPGISAEGHVSRVRHITFRPYMYRYRHIYLLHRQTMRGYPSQTDYGGMHYISLFKVRWRNDRFITIFLTFLRKSKFINHFRVWMFLTILLCPSPKLARLREGIIILWLTWKGILIFIIGLFTLILFWLPSHRWLRDWNCAFLPLI